MKFNNNAEKSAEAPYLTFSQGQMPSDLQLFKSDHLKHIEIQIGSQ